MLLITIVVFGSFAIFRYYANNGDEENWFNKKYRDKFSQNLLWRNLLYLNWDGDSKSDYLLNDKYKKIVIEFDRLESCQIDDDTLKEFIELVDQYTYKDEGSMLIESDIVPDNGSSYSFDDIVSFSKYYRNKNTGDDTATLYIMCLSSSKDHPTNIGITHGSDAIVIFDQALTDTVGRKGGLEKSLLQLSTMLHELGHQLGLEHISKTNCVMNENFETPSFNSLLFLNKMPTDFCQESIDKLGRTRMNL